MTTPYGSEALNAVRVKLLRVEELLIAIRDLTQTWFSSHDEIFRRERHREDLEDIHYFNIPDPPGPMFGVLVGEALHDLRSSLDHLVHALAVVHTGKDTPPKERRIYFPIATGKYEFACAAQHLEKVLPSDALTVIEGLQPYNSPMLPLLPYPLSRPIHPTESQPLRALNLWSSIDKHRRLHVTYPNMIGNSPPPPGGELIHAYPRPVEYGTELFRVRYRDAASYPDDEVEVPLQLLFDIALNERLAGWGVRADFGTIMARIEDTVVPALKPFL